MQIEVAVIGPSWRHLVGVSSLESPDFVDQGPQLAWAERLKVVVEADETTTLADVINRAAERLEIRVPLGGDKGPQAVSEVIEGIGFWKPGDDAPDAFPGPFRNYFVGINTEGRAVWGKADQTLIGDLVRAAERGLVPFDATRVYLHPGESQGADVFIAFWESFRSFVAATWPVVEYTAEAYGAFEFLKAIKRRVGKYEVLDRLRPTLEERLAGPGQVLDLLASKPWTPEEVAVVIDCTPAQAEDLLDLGGLTFVEDRRRWESLDTKDAAFTRALLEQLANVAASPAPELTDGPTAAAISDQLGAILEAATQEPGLVVPNMGSLGHPSIDFGPEEEQPADSASEGDPILPDDEVIYEDSRHAYRLISLKLNRLSETEESMNAAGRDGFQLKETLSIGGSGPRGPTFVFVMERTRWNGVEPGPTDSDD